MLIDRAAKDRMHGILESWLGTPYRLNHAIKGMGCDCKTFVCAVLDEAFCMNESKKIPRLPADTAINNPGACLPFMVAMSKCWHGFRKMEDASLQCGDLVVMRPFKKDEGERRGGHFGIVGAEAMTVYHAPMAGARVRKVGVVGCGLREIIGVYRPKKKDLWS